MVKAVVAAAFTVGFALLGVGVPDLLDDTTKLWVTVAGALLVTVGVLVASARAFTTRWRIVRRADLTAAKATTAASADPPQTRQPLIRALEEHAQRLGDMLDARFAERPGPKGGLLVRDRDAFEAAAPAQADHDRRTLATYFEQFRSPGIALFDEAVDAWWAGSPNWRPMVDRPDSVDDLRRVEHIFGRLAQNLREKEVDRAMEARGFKKQYVAVER